MRRYIALAVLALMALPAHAVPVTFTASMSGANEVPPTGSSGTGFASVVFDLATNLMSVNVTFSGLGSGSTASHIHCCADPGSSAVIATTVPSFPGFPLGVTSGTFTNTFDMSNPSSYNPAFITANGGTVASAETALYDGLLAGDAYLNIHTTSFPTGEIRGLLAPVPEPSTLAMFGFILIPAAGVLFSRRRRASAPIDR